MSFQVPASWAETTENTIHSAHSADGFSLVTVNAVPKSGLTLAEYNTLAGQSMKSYVKQGLHGPDPVTIRGLKGLESFGEAQMESHPGTALLTTLEGKDKFYVMLGLICDQGNSTNRLKLLHDMANSLQTL